MHGRRLVCLVFSVLVVGVCAGASAKVIYVDDDAAPGGDGSSWQTAHKYLQDALVAAQMSLDYPREVRLAGGVYRPDQGANQTLGDREAFFKLLHDLVLKGGYAGVGAADANVRDIKKYETVLSGDLAGNDIQTDEQSWADNSIDILQAFHTGGTAVLEGLTLSGCRTRWWYDEARVLSGNSGIVVRDCVIRNNSTGGVLFDFYKGGMRIENCVFEQNRGDLIRFRGESSFIIKNCIFRDNDCSTAIYCGEATDIEIIACLVAGNHARWTYRDCSAFDIKQSDVRIVNCTIADNDVGVVFCSGTLEMHNCIMANGTDIEGDALDSLGADPTQVLTVSNSRIAGLPSGVVNPTVITDDPLFVNPLGADATPGTVDDNYRLLPDSPCLGAGDSSVLAEPNTLDLDSKPLIQAGIVDMGAYAGMSQNIVLSRRQLTIDEGSSHSLQIRLALPPGKSVEIEAVTKSNQSVAVEAADSLVFDDSNFSEPRTIIVSAMQDEDFLSSQNQVVFRGPGLRSVLLQVQEIDDDSAPSVIYVDDDAIGPHNGLGWSTAFADLQNALAAVRDYPGITEIRIAGGTYKPVEVSLDWEDTWVSFDIPGGLSLIGGYSGQAGPNPDVRDPNLYVTTLSGDRKGDDLKIIDFDEPLGDLNMSENSNKLVTVLDANAPVVFDGLYFASARVAGLTIENSPVEVANCVFHRHVTSNFDGASSALCVYNSNSQCSNCVFIDNYVSSLEHRPTGGAVFCEASDAVFSECIFEHNYGRNGGAVGVVGCRELTYNCETPSRPVFRSCIFLRNYAELMGGAVSASDQYNAFPEFIDCAFIENTAGGYGAVVANVGTIRDCIFQGNRARYGGALGLSVTRWPDAELIIDGCTFVDNSASNVSGAITVSASRSLIKNCRFIGNSAKKRGVIDCLGSYNRIENCLFAGNRDVEASAAIDLYSQDVRVDVVNCTFTDNVSLSSQRLISEDANNLTLRNCIVWDNGPSPLADANLTDVSYCDIQGGWPGVGNIDADPCFVGAGRWDANGTPDDPNDDFYVAGDYHLKSRMGRWDPNAAVWTVDGVTSPCIDAGDPNAAAVNEPYPHGLRVNMGAYGNTPQASLSPDNVGLPGDFDHDARQSFADVGVMAEDWLVQDAPLRADLNLDGRVDFRDLAVLVGVGWD